MTTSKKKEEKMYAAIRRGKRKGELVEIFQWCNDWFNTSEGIKSPLSLAFNQEGIAKIIQHKNNGIMASLYKITEISGQNGYWYGFKRKKLTQPNDNRKKK